MTNWINYPAVFSFDEDGVSVSFPDFKKCLTCGDDTEEATRNAKEALGLHLYGMEIDKEEFPKPSNIIDIATEQNEAVVIIEVYLPAFRDNINNKSVKTNVTLPKWLKDLAEANKVNFSKVLQDALKNYLGIK